MEQLADVQKIPIIDKISIQFICSLLALKGEVQSILELGTAIGYGSIHMARAAPKASIDTIERHQRRYQQACHFINKAKLDHRITVHLADATIKPAQLRDGYDLIFIDAAKGQYQRFFDMYAPLLKPNGFIITDNILFHGLVYGSTTSLNRRKRMLIGKIDSFNKWLAQHPQFMTTFVPIGDGMAISVPK
jgi:predicted O-methyltransferase YrrM